MKNYFFLIFQLPILVFEIFLFKFFKKKNSKHSYSALVKLFCISGGISNSFLNFILSKPLNLKKKEVNNEIKFFKKNGYSLKQNFLSKNFIDNFKDELKKIPGFWTGDDYISQKKEFLISDIKSTKFYYDPSDLLDTESVSNILLNEDIYNLARDYLQNEPILNNIACWHSFPSRAEDSQAAQLWHFDMDRIKWIKFFFYLSDCKNENGPHCFIAGSHLNNGIPWELRIQGYKRLNDKNIDLFFDESKKKIFKEKAGTLLIEDTRGLHKGKKLINGNRLMFQLEFVTSMFGSPYEKIKIKNNEKNKELITRLRSNNFTFQNFDLN